LLRGPADGPAGLPACLTEPDGDQTPSTPGLPALIAESTAAGALAELTEDGDPALASPVVGRTVYRCPA
jgi:hypothetical protein